MIGIDKYLNYPKRFTYNPFQWPPDISLAELHSTCSQPGLRDKYGIQCPCCMNWQKKTINSWWCRNISYDLRNYGAGIPGYFHLLSFYIICITLIIGIYSSYSIYAINFVCYQMKELSSPYCVDGIFMEYLQYNKMIQILKQGRQNQIVEMLNILQTLSFYILLFSNCLCVFFITLFNKSAKYQIKQNKMSNRCHLLIFYGISRSVADNFDHLIASENKNGISFRTLKHIELYELKSYYNQFLNRNYIYYKILAQNTKKKRQKVLKKLNDRLKKSQCKLLQEKQKLGKFSQKVIFIFQDIESKQIAHRMFKLGTFRRWYYGIRTLLKQLGIKDFSPHQVKPCSFRILQGSDILWENIGQTVGVRMASRIKAFLVCFLFIVICYLALYYPMLFVLNADIQKTQKSLTLLQKLLPQIVSLFLVVISISFRLYLNKLSGQRNPKDQVEKSRFILITSTIFHTIFYVLMPFFFFLIPNQINNLTLKLFVISGQARTFLLIQLIINIIDLPYKLWKNKKIKILSKQSQAFKYNQQMLHNIVQFPEYPLQSRLDVVLRFWALTLLYSFLMPSMLILIFMCLVIIYWLEKKNLYRHYALRRKISIRLISEVLTYFVIFFSVFLCISYCINVQNDQVKMMCAIIITIMVVVFNVVFWIVLNKINHVHSNAQSERRDTNLAKLRQTLYESNSNQVNKKNLNPGSQNFKSLQQYSQFFANSYSQFLEKIRNDELDQQVTNYLKLIDDYNQSCLIEIKMAQKQMRPSLSNNDTNQLNQSQQIS